ncbi:MAG TPA: heavy metal translocating P-type ATPase, partial [Jatrophihabitans sp.]|nr:heavy metal translocating P-type ATPase [Jatrophihabitans sp.]
MTATEASTSVELSIAGMTCASCAARIEKKLNKLDGVSATVNYATEKAHIVLPVTLSVAELIGTVERVGYTATLHEPERRLQPPSLLRRLLVSTALTVPVLVVSMAPPLQFRYWQWVALMLATPVVLWCAWPFHRAAWANLRHRATTMDTLVSLGVLAAFAWSLWALFLGEAGRPGMRMQFALLANGSADDIYLEVATAVTTFLLAGRYAEERAKSRSGAALRALLDLGAKDVSVLRGEHEVRVPIGELAVGDRFIVRPGEKVATDGVVLEGSSAIDASLMTGEAVPAEVGPGNHVVGATMNVGGRLVVAATQIGADTQLAQLARLVEQAQSGKAAVQRLADRVSAIFVPVVLLLSSATLAGWLAAGGPAHSAFTAAVAVLIVACPCALGLATPTALMVGTGRGAQLGIVIKGPEVLEHTRRIDTIVLDKTGTVTTGRMKVHDIVAADPDAALRLAGAVETASEHPIAAAIAAAALDRVGTLPTVAQFRSIPGLGATGLVDGHEVVIGRRALIERHGVPMHADIIAAFNAAADAGRTAVLVASDGRLCAVIVVGDAVKPSSAGAVRALRGLGLHPVLLTGDNQRAAASIAQEVGIDDVVAEVLPADKAAHITALQDKAHIVAMVGDGVNDAAALAGADLGIAMGSGTDVAIEASDLTLVRHDLFAVVDAIRLPRATLRTIKLNLFWAFAYNVAAL